MKQVNAALSEPFATADSLRMADLTLPLSENRK